MALIGDAANEPTGALADAGPTADQAEAPAERRRVLGENLTRVQERLDQACDKAGRSRDEVQLLPVSKTWPWADVAALAEDGQQWFGENKVQELLAKHEAAQGWVEAQGVRRPESSDEQDRDPEAAQPTMPRWVMIGHLQRNKVKALAPVMSQFQALDSVRLARSLDQALGQIGRTLDVLVQVNSSGEATKFGLAPAQVLGFADELAQFEHLRPIGLMTIGANSPDAAVVTESLATTARVRDELQRRGHDRYTELSMGMSRDLELAVEHGSTMVRVGTAIFGRRPPANLG